MIPADLAFVRSLLRAMTEGEPVGFVVVGAALVAVLARVYYLKQQKGEGASDASRPGTDRSGSSDGTGPGWLDGLLEAVSPGPSPAGGPPGVLAGEVDGEERRWEVPEGEAVLGRAPTADIRLKDPSVSKEHALLTRHDGSLRVRDLGSRNGVAVRGERTEEADLRSGDELRVGRLRLRVLADPAVGGEEAEPVPVLRQTAGPRRPRSIEVGPEGLTLGTKSTNDVPLDGDGISRHHAEIHPGEDGGWRIRDLGSKNGTYVDKESVDEGPLEPGSVVQIGTCRFAFEVPRPSPLEDPRVRLAGLGVGVLGLFLLLVGLVGGGAGGPSGGELSSEYGRVVRRGIDHLEEDRPAPAKEAFLEARELASEAELPEVLVELADLWASRDHIFSFEWRRVEELLRAGMRLCFRQSRFITTGEEEDVSLGEYGTTFAELPEEGEQVEAARDRARRVLRGGEPARWTGPLRIDAIQRVAEVLLAKREAILPEIDHQATFNEAQVTQSEAATREEAGRLDEALPRYEEAQALFHSIPRASAFRPRAQEYGDALTVNIVRCLEGLGDRALEPCEWRGDRAEDLSLVVPRGESILAEDGKPAWSEAIDHYRRAVEQASGREAGRLATKLRIARANDEAATTYDRGYELLREGEYEEAREALSRVGEETLWAPDARVLLSWIENQIRYREARRVYARGDAERSIEILDEILASTLDRRNRDEVRERRDAIARVLEAFREGRERMEAREYLEAIPHLREIRELEEDEDNYYRDRAERMIDHATEALIDTIQRDYERGLRNWRDRDFIHALENFRRVARFGRTRYLDRIERIVRENAEMLRDDAFYEIIIPGEAEYYPQARAMLTLLIDFLPEGHELRADAILKRAHLPDPDRHERFTGEDDEDEEDD